MTLSENQLLAERWASATMEWERALEDVRNAQERARRHETKVQELRTQLGHTVGRNIERRVFKLELSGDVPVQLVMVEHNVSGPQHASVSLQKLEPSNV